MRKSRHLVEITLHRILWQRSSESKFWSFIFAILKTETRTSLIQTTIYKIAQQWLLDVKCCLLSFRKLLCSTYLVLTLLVGIGRFRLSQLHSSGILFFKEQKSLKPVPLQLGQQLRRDIITYRVLWILFYFQNVICCWNSHPQLCFLSVVQFLMQSLEWHLQKIKHFPPRLCCNGLRISCTSALKMGRYN